MNISQNINMHKFIISLVEGASSSIIYTYIYTLKQARINKEQQTTAKLQRQPNKQYIHVYAPRFTMIYRQHMFSMIDNNI